MTQLQQVPAEQCTHIAIPKEQAQAMFGYLSKQPFEQVNHFMGSFGIRLVKLDEPAAQEVSHMTKEQAEGAN